MAQEKTLKTDLKEAKLLKMSYAYESREDLIHWHITYNRQSEKNSQEHRLLLKVTNEKGGVIDYPALKEMSEQNEWLIEKDYSSSKKGQLMFELPKSVRKLYLNVQMEERSLSDNGALKIRENILDIKEPFVLEIRDSVGTPETAGIRQISHLEGVDEEGEVLEDFIGPKSEVTPVPSTVVPNKGLHQIDLPKYTNKVPIYTTTSNNGVYPTHSWTPTGQSNVKNHQGGYENESGWDGLADWDTSPDNYTNSYIKYGIEKTKPNIALRKYANETSNKDEFTIRLNVRGSTIAKPGVDVCFVLDNSASMTNSKGNIEGVTRKKLAINSLQKLIDKFRDAKPETDSLRIGGVVYSSSEKNYPNPIVPMSSNKANWQHLVDTYQNTSSTGNTYTQKALMNAQAMLNDASGTNRRKVIFLLTDGAPNFSAEPIAAVSDSSIYYDGLRFTKYNEASISQGTPLQTSFLEPGGGRYYTTSVPEGHQLSLTGEYMYSHLTPVNSTGTDIKEQGIEINSIAINVNKILQVEKHSTEELVRGLYKIASKKANATGDLEKDYQFYHANTTGDFDLSFEDWFTSVIQTVDKGVIEDSIGEMYELAGVPEVKEVKKNGVPLIGSDKLPEIPIVTKKKVTIENINLYGNQEVQIDYKLKLKTDNSNYEAGKWYQTNGKTTLMPTPERTSDVLEFGVPSVRGRIEKFKIPVEKKWSDIHQNTEDYWKLRANSVKVALQRKSGNSWEEVETKILDSTNDWKNSFTTLGGNNIYRVVELSRVKGYLESTSNVGEFTAKTMPSKGVQITNDLLKGKAVIYKYKEDGKTPFTMELPKFSVGRKSDGKVLATDLEPDANGQVKISNIPIGDFIIKETYVPTGYIKMDDIELKSVENDARTGLDITLNGKSTPYEVTNKLSKDFKIPLEKIWSDKHQGKENYWGLRQTSIRVTLQRKNESTWETVEQINLTSASNWKDTFSAIEGGSNVYRVIEEVRVSGYAEPTYNYSVDFTAATLPANGVQLTNKLMTGTATFYKFMNDGKTPFKHDLPKFTVRRKTDGKILITDVFPNARGEVKVSNVPIGNFIIEETHVPLGHVKMADIELKAVENTTKTGLDITLDDKKSVDIINRLAEFELNIRKIDQDGNELRGAKFRLVGMNYDKSQNDGPYFGFTGLRPGEYRLTEEVVPNGYQGTNGTVRINISQTGNVEIQSPSNVSGNGGIGNKNIIDLLVTNTKRKSVPLPRTGGTGTEMFLKIAIGIVTIAVVFIGSRYWFQARRGL